MRTRIAPLILSLLAFTAGSLAVSQSASAQEKTITVFAAASMKNALDEVDAAYTKKTGVKLAVSYAASSLGTTTMSRTRSCRATVKVTEAPMRSPTSSRCSSPMVSIG